MWQLHVYLSRSRNAGKSYESKPRHVTAWGLLFKVSPDCHKTTFIASDARFPSSEHRLLRPRTEHCHRNWTTTITTTTTTTTTTITTTITTTTFFWGVFHFHHISKPISLDNGHQYPPSAYRLITHNRWITPKKIFVEFPLSHTQGKSYCNWSYRHCRWFYFLY